MGRIQEGDKIERRDKAMLKGTVERLGGRVSPFQPNEEYIFRTTCLASVSASNLLQHFYTGKQFSADFIQIAA